MTNLLIRTLARQRLSALARPSAVLAFSAAIAYGGGLWLVFMHHIEGGHERNEPSFVMHWLRDSTLALPLICAGVWVGIVLARKLIARAGLSDGPTGLCAALTGAMVALTATIAVGASSPAHADLFGASHGGHELPFMAHLGRDMLVALVVNLLMAGLVSASLFRGRPWAVPQIDGWVKQLDLPRRALINGATALILIAPLAIVFTSGVARVSASASPGSPCPAGVPVKSFDIQSIDVDIPLNRFGDHDPRGKMFVLSSEVDRVRAQERSGRVSIGLRNDAIQPLVIRANIGDCIEIDYTNNASGGEFGIHIDGLAFDARNSGDAVGRNPSSAVARGASRSYRFYVPEDATFEGNHYLRPGPGQRDAINHGLFGALAVEPPGSEYLDMETLEPVKSGWEAIIKPEGRKSFREYVQIYHEIGDEDYRLLDASGAAKERVGKHTDSYRPAARAINYRSEPFDNRFNRPGSEKQEDKGYSSYMFGDPATGIQRAYKGDPTKFRILHAGAEVFHIFHLHGGGIRWRLNPHADWKFSYEKTGLDKTPEEGAPSSRLDSQAFGPGESYDLEIEGGAGGVQQGAGEFLFHCHIAEHYVSGMWGMWRTFDTTQPDLAPLPDRAPLPKAVTSDELIGKTIGGQTITKENLDDWVRPQLPAQGVRAGDQDASVWNWKVDDRSPDAPVYLGEPEDRTNYNNSHTSEDTDGLDGHPNLFPGDRPVRLDGESEDRPAILFNPTNGRPAFPLLRPQIGKRPPFSSNQHSGAPWLGETADKAPAEDVSIDPYANRNDGLCPKNATVRTYNIVTIATTLQTTKATRGKAKVFALAEDVDDILAGRKKVEPLAIRANIGDCVAVTLTNAIPDIEAFTGESKNNLHIHHVQFDTQASDGVITGLSFEQAVEDFATADPTLTADAGAGSKTLRFSSAAKFKPGVAIAVSQGKPEIEIRTIESIQGNVVTLDKPLQKDHATGHHAGTEFVQSRWYPDVQMDNVFWHDHVDGIRGWAQGLVGQLIVEPRGSTYHDPKTGEQVKSGTLVDIRTDGSDPLAKGQVEGSFRELALWTIDDNQVTDSTLNLTAEPWADRLAKNPDPSLLFSSWTHGDPNTPMPRAYAGDPLAIRSVNVGSSLDTLKIDGHRFFKENRFLNGQSQTQASPTDTIHHGVSERNTLILDGGAGGPQQRPGDYMYFNGIGRRFRQGAWGILRVLPKRLVGDLQPLPGTNVPAGGTQQPAPSGGRPPAPASGGQPCPADATTRRIEVSAIDLVNKRPGVGAVFVPTADAAAVRSGSKAAEPLVVHIAAGECLEVDFTNKRDAGHRASFHVSELQKAIESSGVNVGFNPEQTVAVGQSRTVRFHADTRKVGAAMISDFGGNDSGTEGLYGAVVVAPAGATFTDPDTGNPMRFGTGVDVHVPGKPGYRDFTSIYSDDDPIIGGNFMPYPIDVAGPALVNYRTAGNRGDGDSAFSSAANGDPATPMLRAYAGDPTVVHALVAPGSEQGHVIGLGGQSWRIDPEIAKGNETTAQGMGAWEAFDLELIGGAGGRQRESGDYFYGDNRRPFTQQGMWGLMRVLSDPTCPIKPLDGLDCIGQSSVFTGRPPRPNSNPGDAPSGAGTSGAAASGNPVRSAAGAAAGAPEKATGSSAKPRKLRGLKVAKKIDVARLARNGVRVSVTLDASARALQLRLLKGSGAKASYSRKLSRGGTVSFTWKPTRAQLRTARAGRYTLEIKAGSNAKRLWNQTLKTTIQLTGRLARAR
jgi:FtsP/CotA-like multicopper oxidase with cupredoxin domain